MKPIKMSEKEREKPLSYDPKSRKYLYIKDVKEGKIFIPIELNEELQKRLVIKRLEIEDPFSIESLQGMNKEQMIEEVQKNTAKGKDIVRAEINYLKETIEEIRKGNLI